MRIKKNIGGKIATSTAGKSLIRDMLGPTALTILKILNEIIEAKDDKKKAHEIENIMIKIGVKVILLFNNKDISIEELRKCLPIIKQIWSDCLDFCEMSFSYNPESLQNSAGQLEQQLKEILTPYLSEKSLTKMTYCFNYLMDRELLDILYTNDQHAEAKQQLSEVLRAQWDKVFFKDS